MYIRPLRERSEYVFRDAVKENRGHRLLGINKTITHSSVREGILNALRKLRLSG